MDDSADSFGKLSLNAKEWRPGQGFTPASSSSSCAGNASVGDCNAGQNNARQDSASSPSREGSSGQVSRHSQSSWGGESLSHAVDINGTHYFGGGGGNSWESSSLQRDQIIPTPINTTIPSQNYNPSRSYSHHQQQYRNSSNGRATLRNTLSLAAEDYRHYRELSLLSSREMEPNDPRHKAVPSSFCRAYCLDGLDDQKDNPSNLIGRTGYSSGNNNNFKNSNTTLTNKRSSFGYPTSLFRVTSTSDGKLYALRRIDSAGCVSHKIIQNVLNMWMNNSRSDDMHHCNHNHRSSLFQHPGVVAWHKCFISQRAVFFVHQFHVGAVTLKERFFDPNHVNNNSIRGSNVADLGLPLNPGPGVPLPESLIWSCFTQLVSAISVIHRSKLAVRTLQLNHILVTRDGGPSASSSSSYISGMNGNSGFPKLRFRINCLGIVDILEYETRKSLDDLQMEDMRSLGCLILSMTTGTEVTINDITLRNINSISPSQEHQQQQRAMGMLNHYSDFVRQHYSRELHSLMETLVNPNVVPPVIEDVARSMTTRIMEELDGAHSCMDGMNGALAGLYESGRALRLMLKLAFVNERPEFGIDKNWSESGDCYILKLFRDFVFHQADGAGRPVIDLGHVVSSLNKLDAADEEKIVLASRDGKNILVVSYADVARCLEKCYQELCSNSVLHPALT